MPPFKYRLNSSGALAPFQGLNAPGIEVPFTVTTPNQLCVFDNFVDGVRWTLRIEVLNAPLFTDPAIPTIRWAFIIFEFPFGEKYQGSEGARFPDPVGKPPDVSVAPPFEPTRIPNPIEITPLAWDAVV